MRTSRRDLLSGMLGFGVAAALGAPRAHAQEKMGPCALGDPQPFAPDMVREQARALAAEAFGAFDGAVPEVLAGLNYDQHRDIRFRRDAALWHGLGVDAEVQFFHLGYRFRTPVHVYEVAEGMAREVLYTPSSFDFGENGFEPRLSRRPRLCRASPARAAEPAGPSRRACGVPRRQLFPRHRPRAALRVVGARRRDRYRSAQGGGVSELPCLLAGTPGAEQRPGRGACLARRSEPDRRLHVSDPARGCHDHGRRRDAVPARGDRAARDCAADQHVHVRPARPPGRRRLSPAGARLRGLADLVGVGRMVVAAAGQPPGEAQAVAVRQHRSQGLRPDAADARL